MTSVVKIVVFDFDGVTHLLDPKISGYPVYLTTWGVTIKEYLYAAEQHYIPLLDDCKKLLEDFYES
jgi:hypothetical protein